MSTRTCTGTSKYSVPVQYSPQYSTHTVQVLYSYQSLLVLIPYLYVLRTQYKYRTSGKVPVQVQVQYK